VDEKDVQNNFFLDTSCVGKSMAQTTMEYLRELNEDVKGHYDERVRRTLLFDHI
jgi:molybdopterin/thiamine biosynthesis adenylyltransferase